MTKRIAILCVKLLVVGCSVAYLLWSGKFDPRQLAVAPQGWLWIGLAGLLCVTAAATAELRFWRLLRAANVKISLGRVVQVGFVSWFFNATMLGGLGFLSGDAIKAAYLMRESDRRASILGAVLADRVLGVLGILTIAVLALQLAWGEISNAPGLRTFTVWLNVMFVSLALSAVAGVLALVRNRQTACAVSLVAGAVAAAGLARMDIVWPILAIPFACALAAALLAPLLLPGGRAHAAIQDRVWMGRNIIAFTDALLAYRNRVPTLLAGYGISTALQAMMVLILFVTAQGLSAPVRPSLQQVGFAAPPAFALTVAPLPANGLGFGEGAFDTMLAMCSGPTGAPLAGGAAIYLAFRILMTIASFTGLPCYLAMQRKKESPLGDEGNQTAAPRDDVEPGAPRRAA